MNGRRKKPTRSHDIQYNVIVEVRVIASYVEIKSACLSGELPVSDSCPDDQDYTLKEPHSAKRHRFRRFDMCRMVSMWRVNVI